MKKKNGKRKVQRLAIAGVLLALILVFLLVPIPSISGVSLAVIPLIAVVIACQFDGILMGLFCGLAFGLASLIGSYTTGAGSLLAFAFHNPLISVFPRIMIPITCYFSYVGMRKFFKFLYSHRKKYNEKVANHFAMIISSGVSSGVAVLTNTALVMSLIYAFHVGAAVGNDTIGLSFLWGIIVINAPFEFAVCILGAPAILIALKSAFHQLNDKYSIKRPNVSDEVVLNDKDNTDDNLENVSNIGDDNEETSKKSDFSEENGSNILTDNESCQVENDLEGEHLSTNNDTDIA